MPTSIEQLSLFVPVSNWCTKFTYTFDNKTSVGQSRGSYWPCLWPVGIQKVNVYWSFIPSWLVEEDFHSYFYLIRPVLTKLDCSPKWHANTPTFDFWIGTKFLLKQSTYNDPEDWLHFFKFKAREMQRRWFGAILF